MTLVELNILGSAYLRTDKALQAAIRDYEEARTMFRAAMSYKGNRKLYYFQHELPKDE